MVPERSPVRYIKAFLWILCVVLLMGMLAGCAGSPTAPEQDTVDVQLKWVHQAQFAGFYVAQEKGYYEEENLAVSLHEGGPDVDLFQQVLSGAVDYAVVSPEDLLVKRGQGEPLTAIAVIYRQNPMTFVAMEGSGIKRPADILGQTVAVAPDGIIQFRALMNRLDLDLDQIEFGEYDYAYGSFIAGEVDVTEAYATGGIIRLHNQGYALNVIWPDDYGVHFYADTLVARDEFIAKNPQLTTRFLRATLRGWQEAMGNGWEAVEMTMKYAQESDPEVQRQMLEASIPLVHTGKNYPGWMEKNIWQSMYEVLHEEGMLDASFPVDEVYTMQFVEEVYERAD